MKHRIKWNFPAPLVAMAGLLLLMASCTHTVQVADDYPTPVGEQIPLSVGIYLSEDFKNYTYREDSEDREEWNINTGRAQKNLFETVLGSMFSNTVSLSQFPQKVPANVEIVLVPEVRELQFTMPRETRVNIFEVWIKYDINAYDPQGEQLANWVITAYGKTPTAFLKTQEQALAQAINIALRDAGATLYTGFEKVPELRAFLSGKLRSASLQEFKVKSRKME
ncbi:hypothetical protein [Microbulbifer spongiae]|uniref:DUF4136 domain-containing protein n=1 Tax=Microbulbifer spongiae TaxID=2944933 RepID=A0ABY9EAV7_9GAMM|nr:hypothetical protein [Microbulbifer sp. MI-G]WKD49218.1 hypothetical protein M8T91_15140 [Microbulbifer sp. MI-G]